MGKKNKRKKIGIVIWNFEYRVGGAERVCNYLKKILEERYSVEIIDKNSIPTRLLIVFSPFLFYFPEITSTYLLNQEVNRRKKDLDLIITNGFNGAFLKKIEVPRINIYHGFMKGYRKILKKYLGFKRNQYLKILEKLEILSGRNSTNVVVNREYKKIVEKRYKIKIHEVIYNGIDTHLFRPASLEEKIYLRKKYNLPLNKPLILFTGRMEIGKGVDILKKVIQKKKNLHFLLLTNRDLKYYPQFKTFSNVSIFLEVHYSTLPEFYKCADVFFLPSRFEACELSTLEAISAGLIPVGFEVGIMQLIKKELEMGYILPVNADIMKIERKMGEAVNKIGDQVYIQKLRNFVEKNFSLDIFKKKWIKLISKVI